MAPAPIVSRVYQELAHGIVGIIDAQKITDIVFPFPFAQMVSGMLMITTFITPLVMATIMESRIWCCVITFITIFSYWCINYIAAEIEMPFGDDLNDLPVGDLQEGMNTALLMLVDEMCTTPPAFDYDPEVHQLCKTIACPAYLVSDVQFGGMRASVHKQERMDKGAIRKKKINHIHAFANERARTQNFNGPELRHSLSSDMSPLSDVSWGAARGRGRAPVRSRRPSCCQPDVSRLNSKNTCSQPESPDGLDQLPLRRASVSWTCVKCAEVNKCARERCISCHAAWNSMGYGRQGENVRSHGVLDQEKEAADEDRAPAVQASMIIKGSGARSAMSIAEGGDGRDGNGVLKLTTTDGARFFVRQPTGDRSPEIVGSNNRAPGPLETVGTPLGKPVDQALDGFEEPPVRKVSPQELARVNALKPSVNDF